MIRDPGSLRRAHDEHVVDVAGLVGGQLADLTEPELGVTGNRLTARTVPLLEVREEDAQKRSLELVEPRVVADELEVLLVAGAVEAEEPHALRELVVVGRDETAVPEREQVLGREEAVR